MLRDSGRAVEAAAADKPACDRLASQLARRWHMLIMISRHDHAALPSSQAVQQILLMPAQAAAKIALPGEPQTLPSAARTGPRPEQKYPSPRNNIAECTIVRGQWQIAPWYRRHIKCKLTLSQLPSRALFRALTGTGSAVGRPRWQLACCPSTTHVPYLGPLG